MEGDETRSSGIGENWSNSHVEVLSTVRKRFYDVRWPAFEMEYPFRFIIKHLFIDHSLFFCFREPCDPVPSFISFIVSTQVNTLLKTHSNSFLRKMCFLPHFTNKQIIQNNKWGKFSSCWSRNISSPLFDFFLFISFGHLPATYTSKLFRTLLNKKNNWSIY